MTKTTYQLWIERHYSAVLAVLRFILTQFADEAIEIAARAVMLAAPLPNAISVYHITQRTQGFNLPQALAFALTIEIVIFFLIEVALLMLTRWLQGKAVYKYAFYGMCLVVVVVAAIIINLVYTLDDYKVMAWMPVLSICSFIGIGLKRWDARNMERPVKSVKPGVKESVKLPGEDFTGGVKSDLTERQSEILQLLTPLSGQAVKDVNKSELARKVGVSRPTFNKELDALRAAGAISMNGHVEVRL